MITPALENNYPDLIEIWEQSVRATHGFLPEAYLQHIKTLLPSIFPVVQIFIHPNNENIITGFGGIADDKMEMLFIHPHYRGQGIGKTITEYLVKELHITKVDVNEQNEQAVGFYKKLGFVVIGRTERDGLGKPFPILQMQLGK